MAQRVEFACSVGDLSSIPGLGRPPKKKMATHSSILAWKKSHGWRRSLVGYSPEARKELDMTKQLYFDFSHSYVDSFPIFSELQKRITIFEYFHFTENHL